MVVSREAIELSRLEIGDPKKTKPGDIFYNDRSDFPLFLLALGHNKHHYKNPGHTFVWLYHNNEGCLTVSPKDLRDNDNNALSAEKMMGASQRFRVNPDKWKYVGNLFEIVPLSLLMRIME